MTKYAPAFIVLCCAIFSGCVTSLNPIYTDKDIVFDTSILGEWHDPDSPEKYAFSQSGENEYHLVYTDDNGVPADFTLRMVRLDSLRFFDVFPDEPDLGGNEFYEMHFLPVHSFVRILSTSPTLDLATIDDEWLNKYLQTHPQEIAGQEIEGELVLTGQTSDLQKFLIHISGIKGAFDEPTQLIRGE
ncbi:MAG TPA: hypothetical protein VJ983_10965 [candidate division Zixibacteria bacterium]|nr:hypothetical protein [candidate division Zixibacteria bacterium]